MYCSKGTLSIMALRGLACDPLSSQPIDLSIEEHVEKVNQMTVETKSDLVVGIRCYDCEQGFAVHLVSHGGDQTKSFQQRRCLLTPGGGCTFGAKERLDRAHFDRYMDTRLAVWGEKHLLVPVQDIKIGHSIKTVPLFGLEAVAILGKQAV